MPELLTRKKLEQPINDAIASEAAEYTIEARAIAPIIVRMALLAQAEALEWVAAGRSLNTYRLRNEATRLRKEAE